MALLEIRNLSVEFPTARGVFRAVDGINITLEEGELLGVVGESGSGKSVTMLALMGLLPWTASVTADLLEFNGRNLLGLSPAERRAITGKDMAMIFQEPMTSLNPCFTVGFQIMEQLKVHEGGSRAERRRRAIELLDQVGIPAPESRLGNFPHQMSGGMNQRVMIAMSIACNPRLLIADEPTTALDVTIQAQILDLLVRLQSEHRMALVLITHDMAVIAETARRVSVMYAGQQVETRLVENLFERPRHPYTGALLDALPERSEGRRRLPTIPGVVPGAGDRPEGCLFNPRCAHVRDRCRVEAPPLAADGDGLLRCFYPVGEDGPDARAGGDRGGGMSNLEPAGPGARSMTGPGTGSGPVLEAVDVARHYTVSRGMFAGTATVKALASASFSLTAGRTLAVVGESGCGKSTLARLVTLIEKPTAGSLLIDGADVAGAGTEDLKRLRQEVQIVFQDPYGSLNPRKKVGVIIEEPLVINTTLSAAERRQKAEAMMERVGLRAEHYDRYPHMFSGGQRQRIAVARALMLQPRILVADEPVSALDVSIQAQVLNLLMDLQEEFNLAYLFISHDLSVVRHIADEVMVMYLGRPVEHGSRDAVFAKPAHPYTRALLASTPAVDPKHRGQRVSLKGELPSPLDPPPGCAFHRRCPHATDLCAQELPDLRPFEGRQVACHHAESVG